MAMHRKLEVGSIVCNFMEIKTFSRYGYIPGTGYRYTTGKRLEINSLYVYTRRARTNGALVPAKLIPLLDKFGIRHNPHRPGFVIAVGCEVKNIRKFDMDGDKIPFEALMATKEIPEFIHETDSFKNTEFVESHINKQGNTVKKGLLIPISDELAWPYKLEQIQEIPDDNFWIEPVRFRR